MTLDEAVRARLLADPVLSSELARYDIESAVFFGGRVPADAGLPFVVVDVPTADLADDTKTTLGRDVTLTVRSYAGPNGTSKVGTIAERTRTVLHRQPVGVDPYSGWLADADGPVPAPTDRSMVGRSVSVRLRQST